MENRSHTTKIQLGQEMVTNILSINFVSLWLWLCAISNTKATSQAEFMKKLNNTEAELNKNVAVTDSCRDGWNLRNYSSSHVQVFT